MASVPSSSSRRDLRLLQVAMALAGLVPVVAGLAGVVQGTALLDMSSADPVSADSHFRYLSGLLLGIGLVAWSLIPRIERNGAALRILAALVFIGGVARLASFILIGAPSLPMLFGLVMELAIVPALTVWQSRIARRLRAS